MNPLDVCSDNIGQADREDEPLCSAESHILWDPFSIGLRDHKHPFSHNGESVPELGGASPTLPRPLTEKLNISGLQFGCHKGSHFIYLSIMFTIYAFSIEF